MVSIFSNSDRDFSHLYLHRGQVILILSLMLSPLRHRHCEEGSCSSRRSNPHFHEEIASGWVSIRRKEQERGYSTTSPRNDIIDVTFSFHSAPPKNVTRTRQAQAGWVPL